MHAVGVAAARTLAAAVGAAARVRTLAAVGVGVGAGTSAEETSFPAATNKSATFSEPVAAAAVIPVAEQG